MSPVSHAGRAIYLLFRDSDVVFDILAVYGRRSRRGAALLAGPVGALQPDVHRRPEARGSPRRRYRSMNILVQAIDRRFAIPWRMPPLGAPPEFFRKTGLSVSPPLHREKEPAG